MEEEDEEGRSSADDEAAAQTTTTAAVEIPAAVRLAGAIERGAHALGVARDKRAAPGAGIATLRDAAATRRGRKERFMFRSVTNVG